MGKLIDLFKKAQDDPALLADMEAVQKGQGGKYIDIDSIVGSLIKVAADHGISLEYSDFRYNYGELADSGLASVVGGVASSSLAKLWLDLYNTQSSTNNEDTEKQA